jgi:tetratricopeptide (TPR) repeat protein
MMALKGRPELGVKSPSGTGIEGRVSAGAAFLVLLLSLSAGCGPAVVRVKVPSEDLIRANALAGEGDILFARKDYYAALIKYLESSKLNPNSEYICNKMGISYSRLKYYPQAIEAFMRSIALNPKYPYSYNNMGSVFFADNNKKKAENYFRKAISIKGDEASFHINLGTLLFEKKDYEKGLLELRKGLALDPEIMKRSEGGSLVAAVAQKNSPEKSYFLARFYASSGNIERAIESLQEALAHGFTNLEALRTEKDFDPIRKDEKFVAFLKYATQLIKS